MLVIGSAAEMECDRCEDIRIPYGDLNTVIREDEGRVGGCQLSGRHCD